MLKWAYMEIKILDKKSVFLKGKKENVLIDPTKEILNGGKFPSRIVAYTSNEMGYELANDKVILQGPGEYEVGGVEILGINGGNEQTIYTFSVDNVLVCVIGELMEPLSDKKIEKINNVDVLITSIKSRKGVDNKLILDWAKKWGANYLIPVDYEEGNEDFKKFLDDTDMEGAETLDLLKVEKDNLPDGMEVKILKKI